MIVEGRAVDFESIKSAYVQMRMTGVDARSALSGLRVQIASLEAGQRDRLLDELRRWEIHRAAHGATSRVTSIANTRSDLPAAHPVPAIRPIQVPPPAAPPADDPLDCETCGKRNRSDAIFCTACGQLLTMERGEFETHQFADDDGVQRDDYFGPDTTLVFVLKDSEAAFRIRPQDLPHEVVVGRGAGGTMRPDIDLGPHQAGHLGVSRLHLSVTYHEKKRTLSVTDMGSANGTFINGQRLHPEEIRVIRHGDELRLGKLGLRVYFFPDEPPRQADTQSS